MRYYTYLQGTRELTEEGFSNWIKFFLQSIINQVDRNITFIDNINTLYQQTLQTMKSLINSTNVEIFVKAIFKRPIFTTEILYQETGLNKNTIRHYIKVLKKEYLLFDNQQRRNTKYYFMELIDLMN